MESPQPVEATGTYDPRPNNSHSRVEYRTASTGGRIGRIGRIWTPVTEKFTNSGWWCAPNTFISLQVHFCPIAILFSVCALGKTWSVKIGNESTSSPPPEFIETVLSNPSDSLGFYCLKHLLKLDMIIPNFKEIAYLKCKKHKVLRQQWRQRR